jgi:DHA2 family multidrug resistance protein
MVVMFITGFILISTTQVLPQFLQSLMGYDATKAGLALTAGGVVTFCMMPVVGALLRRAQPKYLIAFGLAIEAAACVYLAGFNTDVSFWHVAVGRMAQAVGLPFLFVPITTVAYAGLPPGKSNNASALINTMRNLGGSFGISVSTTILARRGQFHHARLAERITALAPAYSLRGPSFSLSTLIQAVEKQAQMLSYVDIFHLLAWLAALAIPTTFLLRQLKPEDQAAGH